MFWKLAAMAALGAACLGCSAPRADVALSADNPANPDAPSAPFVRPVNILATGGAPVTTVPSTAMMMAQATPGPAPGKVSATGTVNSVDPAKHTVNVTHAPIKALGWPSMTMDFPVNPSIDLKAVKPGEKIGFSLGGADASGNRRIEQLQPADK
jgi:Cu/Ag efflux protein CusF